MIDYEDQGDLIACYTYCYRKSDDVFIGSLKQDDEGNYEFHPSRRVILNCRVLRHMYMKLHELNTAEG